MQTIVCKDTARLENILFVLNRDNIKYTIEEGNPLTVNLPDSTAEDVIIIEEDADCEEQRNNSVCKAPVYSLHTLENPQKRDRLRKLNNSNSYRILNKDRKEYYQTNGFTKEEIPEEFQELGAIGLEVR